MTDIIKLKAFLTELTHLTNKYGYEIGGCGCCGSPWVCSESDSADMLYYDKDEKIYKVQISVGDRTARKYEIISADSD